LGGAARQPALNFIVRYEMKNMEGTDDFSTICFALLALKKATPFVEGPVAPMRIGALFLHGCHVCHLSQVSLDGQQTVRHYKVVLNLFHYFFSS